MDATAINPLTIPLGTAALRVKPLAQIWPFIERGIVATAASLAALVAGFAIYGDPDGGRPTARVEIATATVPSRPAPANPHAPPGAVAAPETGRRDAGSVEASSGVSVVRPAGSVAPHAVVITVLDAEPGRLAPAPDPRLVEKSRHGLLPIVGPDGARPLAVYARPPGQLPGGMRPAGRIAIVVGGLGISRSATEDAIRRLPAAMTLAFAPYGEGLEDVAPRARNAGHETVLQIPMEPFDYPDSDPGPRLLLAGARVPENLDNLRWVMGRFTGYVALMNYMGGKVTADEKALAPILREIGTRGLGMIDDGSSARSLVSTLRSEAPTLRADLMLDAVPRADLIDKALEALEASAASGRIVVATASALPVTVDRLARWAERLEARGILLVPVSAALTQPREGGRT